MSQWLRYNSYQHGEALGVSPLIWLAGMHYVKTLVDHSDGEPFLEGWLSYKDGVNSTNLDCSSCKFVERSKSTFCRQASTCRIFKWFHQCWWSTYAGFCSASLTRVRSNDTTCIRIVEYHATGLDLPRSTYSTSQLPTSRQARHAPERQCRLWA